VATEHLTRDGKYYTDSDIAGLLGISLGRLRNKLSAGNPLPAAHSATGLPQPAVASSGGAFPFSRSSYHNREMRISYTFQ
jgi:hypothetical protein